MPSMIRLENLPEELVDQIFQEFALQIPVHRLIRLRLVSKFFSSRLMSPRVFPIATRESHINFCQDKDTIMKWLRWSFRNPACSNPMMNGFRRVVDQFLHLAVKNQDDLSCQDDKYDVDSVSEVLLDLIADQMLIYRWKMCPRQRNFDGMNQLLWWRHRWSLGNPEMPSCICLCIASAFGDMKLFDSMFEETLLTYYPMASQYVGLPVYAAVRSGQTQVMSRLLAREGHMQLCQEEWTILDQAIYSERQQQPPAVLLDVAYRFDSHHFLCDTTAEEALREVMVRALETAATYRNYHALKMVLSRLEATSLPVSDEEQHRVLFAACLGQDSGFDMTEHIFAVFPALSPNCVAYSPYHFAGRSHRCPMRPLDAAICRGDVHLVKLLLDHGASPEWGADMEFGPTKPPESFAYAARRGFVNCLTLLLNAGLGQYYLSGAAVVNASLSGDPAAVKLLLDTGIQLDAYNQADAMANAYVAGTESLIELLRSRGYDCEEAKTRGESRMMVATSKARMLQC